MQQHSSGRHSVRKYNKSIPAYPMKGHLVTKMQIIAKAILTLLGISATVTLCWHLSVLIPFSGNQQSPFTPPVIIFLPFFIILITAIVYLLVFKNDWLACKMAGSGEKLNPEDETLWLTCSLRIVAVFYGLILLCDSIPAMLNIITLLYIRSHISVTPTGGATPQPFIFSRLQWPFMIYNFLETILAVYLLYGWPQFVRFQSNICKTKSPPDQNQYTEGISK